MVSTAEGVEALRQPYSTRTEPVWWPIMLPRRKSGVRMSEVSDATTSSPLSGGQLTYDASSYPEWLDDAELEMVFFIERYHAMQGEVPNDDTMKRRWNLEPETLNKFKQHPLVQKSLVHRGITYPPLSDRLTARQMAAAATMLDNIDKRSDEKKLRDIGVTSREYASWCLNETFAAYMLERSERMLANSQHEAHKGLLKGVRNGNVASIKTYYQITGRHDPDAGNQVNVSLMLNQFIEAIQQEIRDPVILHRIAAKLTNIASAGAMQPGVQTIRGQHALSSKDVPNDDI